MCASPSKVNQLQVRSDSAPLPRTDPAYKKQHGDYDLFENFSSVLHGLMFNGSCEINEAKVPPPGCKSTEQRHHQGYSTQCPVGVYITGKNAE